ncbi:MAG TPA: PPOX class F420-dependent oxidoreductase [Nocardioides sp.]|uniref:PPOX class F420-dependent oxidoreductase n=1 Tax=Nocardioides sp. TaxID=35761 RepID=UPI002B5EF1CC|nr:PPOX class F420-dependent oxidoreductase [Nocardioides sp.]HQR28273.1 PPOX class F420-dependent oxidoreductase [Nocardioides sp.]
MTNQAALDVLGRATYLRLTTFRKDGTPVPTPVWLARDGDFVVVTTSPDSGKVKRLRHTTRVLVAPCDGRGRLKKGARELEATAELVTDPVEADRIGGLIKEKYGVGFHLVGMAYRLLGKTTSQGAGIRITV